LLGAGLLAAMFGCCCWRTMEVTRVFDDVAVKTIVDTTPVKKPISLWDCLADDEYVKRALADDLATLDREWDWYLFRKRVLSYVGIEVWPPRLFHFGSASPL